MVGFANCAKENVFSSSSESDDIKAGSTQLQNGSPTHRSRAIHPRPWCGQHQTGQVGSTKNVYNYSNQEDKEKTPMCRIAELARYHKLKHEYKLMDESGPAHKKMFTVQLVLIPDQVFEGSGASIKKAQQSAAAAALDHTTLTLPPDRSGKRKKDPSSPTVLLSHVARRLGLPEPIYRSHSRKLMRARIQGGGYVGMNMNGINCAPISNGFINGPAVGPVCPLVSHSFSPATPTGSGVASSTTPHLPGAVLPNPAVSHTFGPLNSTVPCFPPFDQSGRLCVVSVAIGPGRVFTGVAHTFVQAKAHAATQCLVFLGPSIQALDEKIKLDEQKKKDDLQQLSIEDCIPVGIQENNTTNYDQDQHIIVKDETIPKHKQKSVISQVHECALQMKLNVEFEVLGEDGPPHDRSYVVRCSLRTLKDEAVVEADGKGRKKKEATQAACSNVLARLRGENSPLFIASSLYKSQKKILNAPKEPKRKTIIKDMKMDPSYGHQINPVSRLIQVLQARNEDDPQFELVGEHGQSRYKEFTVQVMCSGRVCTGNGPNKRLAKRAAAEAMLAEIGYVKPLPSPGKSLLKKKGETQMQIGVFDPNEVMTVPSPPSVAEGEFPVDDSERCLQEMKGLSLDSNPSPPQSESPDSTSLGNCGVPPSPGVKRRVTFSNQVKACPPPEDSNYPEPELAPLKADVVVEGRVKRIRRSKEAKRALSDEQKSDIRDLAKLFLRAFCQNTRVALFTCMDGTGDGDLQIETAKRRLEVISEQFKFSVQYTNFPKSPDGSDQLYFALVSLGLERPIVCHGSGITVDAAAENAAYNAVSSLSLYGHPQQETV